MSDIAYLTCQHCRQEFSFTQQDRQLAPYVVDMHLRLHVDVCEGVDTMAAVLETEIETHLRTRAVDFCPERRILDGHLHGCNNPAGHDGWHWMRRL